ncbi:MAG: DUF6901 family protein [Desulfococcaceae bacterium]
MEAFSILYRYTLLNGHQEEFPLRLHPETLVLMENRPPELPKWSRLAFHKCSNCPRRKAKNPACAVAVNLVDLVSRFEGLTSYDELFVEVETPERVYYKKTSAQRGISSLMGLLIAASECPLTDFFKPMARFHLPFATEEETIWRATSTYMLGQYFARQAGRSVDFEMSGLEKVYRDIQQLNRALAQRLRAACEADSPVNAVIILDAFAKSLPTVIAGSLEQIRYAFQPTLKSR